MMYQMTELVILRRALVRKKSIKDLTTTISLTSRKTNDANPMATSVTTYGDTNNISTADGQPQTPILRRSTRQRTNTKLYKPGESNTQIAEFVQMQEELLEKCPEWCMMSFYQALKKDSTKARKGLMDEIKQHKENNTFEFIAKENIGDSYLIPSLAVAAEKKDHPIKVRLVADGSKQDPGSQTYEDISSPTLKTQPLMILLAISATRGLRISAYDIKGAYLKAELKSKKRIVVRFNNEITKVMRDVTPDIPTDSQGASYAVLKKALYGLKQSGKLFYLHLCNTLKQLGYDGLMYDRCVFRRKIKDKYHYIAVYVDDIIMFTDDEMERSRVEAGLTNIYGELKIQTGNHITYRGIEMHQGNGEIFIDQSPYIIQLCSQFNINKSVKKPTTADLFEINTLSAPAEDPIAFRNGVAKILWLAGQTRPDVKLLASFLSTRLINPTKQDELKLQRGLKYLYGTTGLGIKFSKCELKVNASIDAAHLVHNDAHGHTGAHIRVGVNLVDAISRKQSIVAQSSAEAELIGLNQGLNHLRWCINIMNELGFPQLGNIVYQDNLSTIPIAEGGYPTPRTKHLAMRYFNVRIQDYR